MQGERSECVCVPVRVGGGGRCYVVETVDLLITSAIAAILNV